jgi:hypothetical protein
LEILGVEVGEWVLVGVGVCSGFESFVYLFENVGVVFGGVWGFGVKGLKGFEDSLGLEGGG